MKRIVMLLISMMLVTVVHAEMIKDAHPDLELSILKWAKLSKLDGKTILKTNDLSYTELSLIEEVKTNYPDMAKEADKNLLFFLEESLGRKLLVASARKEGHNTENEEEAIMNFLLSKVKNITIDDAEAKKFYDMALAGVEGMKFENVKEQIKTYLLNQKKKEAIREYLSRFGEDKQIEIDKAWFEKHLKKLKENPVDEARGSGKVTFVQFGADGCEPCELMRPFIKELGEKYKGKKNIVFVDVTKHRLLAIRYGVEMIPVQTFYDRSGKEVFRHVGFFSKEQIEKKLTEIEGVK